MTSKIDYKILFRSLPGIYAAVFPDDPSFTIAEISDAYIEQIGVNRAGIIGKPILEAFPDTSEEFKKTGKSIGIESFRRVIKTGKPNSLPTFRYDIKQPDGSMKEKYWRATHYPLFDDKAKLQLIYAVTEDVTSETSADKELETTKQLLDDALSVGMVGSWTWNIPTNALIVDRNFAQLFGIPSHDVAKTVAPSAFTSGLHPDDRERVKKEVAQALQKKNTFKSEYRTLDHEGSTHWVIAQGRIERDKNDEAIRFPGVLVDITERKLIENNLSFLAKASAVLSSSLDYRKTLQSIAELAVPEIADWCAIEILDEDTHQLKRVAIAHKDPEKVKWAKELRARQGAPDLDAPTGIANVLRTGKAEYYPYISDEMIKASTPDKEQLKLLRELGLSSAIIAPLKVRGSTIGAISLVSTELKRHYTKSDFEMTQDLADRASLAMTNAHLYETAKQELTERERLQVELQKANQELESRVKTRTHELEASNTDLRRSNDELEGFAYVASHDLQEPLRKIQAFSDLLETEYADKLGEGKDYVYRMHKAASRMSILIEDLLAFSRVSTKPKEFSELNLNRIVTEVLGDLETRISETNGKVTVGKLPTIQADPLQMRQLFQNLIGNALKFHKENVPPAITVKATVRKTKDAKIQTCKIEVEDNGVGFDEKYLDRIFAVFQRLHGRDAYQGTGIGLAVCRKIIERHHGHITAESKSGVGSKFIITLPLRQKKGAARG